jgi:hypothetical protein
MEKRPTFREKVLAVFQGKNTNNIPWQPRLEHWFNVNRARNQLVEPYQSMKLLDLYKKLNCSVRYYYGEAQDISSPNTFIHFDYPPGAGVFEFQQGDDIKVIFRSAKGEELIGKKRLGEWGCSWHYIEHPVKNIEDLRVLEDIVTSVSYRFDKDFYLEAKKLWVNGERFSFIGKDHLSNGSSYNMLVLKILSSSSMTILAGFKSI